MTVEIGGKDAFTNGRTIRLPSLPAQADATFLGLVRGYIDHESAHIRHTDFAAIAQAAPTPLERHIWNIFEDWRVERDLSRHFPGCRRNFHWLIRHLFLTSADTTPSPSDAVLSWLLLRVRSWKIADLDPRCRVLAEVIEKSWPGLVAEMETILTMMRGHCPDSMTCLNYARQVVDLLKNRRGLETVVSSSAFAGDLGDILRQEVAAKAEEVGRLKETYGPRLGNIHYLWARERVHGPNPHYHVALLVNGSLMQNPYGLLSDVGAIWNRILGGVYAGLIHSCGSQCLGDSTTGNVMIRRPSAVAEPAIQAQQEQVYQAAYDQALYRASCLAKNFSKGGAPHRVREFGCSQL